MFKRLYLNVVVVFALLSILISCSTNPNTPKFTNSSAPTSNENNSSKPKQDQSGLADQTSSEFKELAKDKDYMQADVDYLTKEEIIKTDVVATNPINQVTVRDFKVNISQIDNSKFPEVTMVVSVTDKDNNPLVVNSDFFQIEEHGRLIPKDSILKVEQQKNLTDKAGNLPLNVILAIDKSGSMKGNEKNETDQPLWFAKKAAVDFVRQLQQNDLVQVIAFDGDIHPLGVNDDAVPMIESLKPQGSTALYGALFQSVKELQVGGGVKAVILLSDGKNDTQGTINRAIKSISLMDGIRAADQLAIPVFTIGFGKGFDDFTLDKIARDTHALFFKTANKEEIGLLYKQIRNIINTQYVITYKSNSLEIVTDVTARLGKYLDQRTFTTPEHVIKQRQEIIQKLTVLREEQARLAQAEKELNQRMADLNKKEVFLKGESTRLDGNEKQLAEEKIRLTNKESELNRYDEAVKKLETEANKEKDRLGKLSISLDAREGELNDRERKMDEREAGQNKRSASLDKKDDDLNAFEAKLAKMNLDLDNKTKSENTRLGTWETKLNDLEKRLNTFNAVLNNKDAKLIKENARLVSYDNDLKNREKQVQSENTRLTTWNAKLSDFEKSLNNRETKLNNYDASLKKTQLALDQRDKSQDDRESRLQDKNSSLNRLDGELKQLNKELDARQALLNKKIADNDSLNGRLIKEKENLASEKKRLENLRGKVTQIIKSIEAHQDELKKLSIK